MSRYDDRPWLARYDAGQPSDIELEFTSALAMFSTTVQRDPDAVLIRYFDGVLTRREVAELSDSFANTAVPTKIAIAVVAPAIAIPLSPPPPRSAYVFRHSSPTANSRH